MGAEGDDLVPRRPGDGSVQSCGEVAPPCPYAAFQQCVAFHGQSRHLYAGCLSLYVVNVQF